ncbi:MAG: HAMP domain-containing histidine kinase [Tannerella sp.]|jgi:signal transduction histidine kinase|nr:HAMP domain-containing histidine kinase [Tannerella sp.]
MKKSTIWLLTVVMGFAFAGLIYLQVYYIGIISKTSNEQFDATVRRSLEQVSGMLENDEARKFIEEDIEHFYYKNPPNQDQISHSIQMKSEYQFQVQSSTSGSIFRQIDISRTQSSGNLLTSPSKDAIVRKSEENQRNQWLRYQHQARLVEEVIYSMLYTAYMKPIEERIDFAKLNGYLKSEFLNNGLNLPYVFMVINKDGQIIYQNEKFDKEMKASNLLTEVLFPGDPPSKRNYLKIYFPTKDDYIQRSVSFLAPSVLFSLILLVTFSFTIYIIFRQKKLSEMKNDFVNNMTHELKTPVSTILLASQMLRDTDLTKSPETFVHISGVIRDESKRLGFLVEKVLQISLFERQKAILKLKELDANDLIASVAGTFSLKVENCGGSIDIDLQAEESTINADKMHLENVLYNLLDNAVKYRREKVSLRLMIRTKCDNTKLYIYVEDNGIGIKKEYLKKIFDRFYRVPTGNVHDVKGFGLGLAYVRKIVEDHGGHIHAEQEEGFIGTKFIITLPLIKK